MDEGYASCNFLSSRVNWRSASDEPVSRDISVASRGRGDSTYRQMFERLFPGGRPYATNAGSVREIAPLNLEPDEWVEVRPLGEITGTLDERRRFKGLYFMPEMERFCGQRFRVMKKVRTIKLESTSEVRRIVDPTVLLEGVYCDGERHQGCDRACLHLWREAWLRRVPDRQALKEPAAPAIGV